MLCAYKNSVINSLDSPIIIKFSIEEINLIKNLPIGHDMLCLAPPSWKKEEVEKFLEENKAKCLYKRLVSDDEIKRMLG